MPDNLPLIEEVQNWIQALQGAERLGAEKDEPEGARYIIVSETLTNNLVTTLEGIQIMLRIQNHAR